MSKASINQYYVNLERAIQFSKSKNEDTIKSYFWMLLNEYAHALNYELAREVYVRGTKGSKVKPDGILRNHYGLDLGLWESKDEKDDIDEEINVKQRKGYPFTNILFEDTKVAVLIQRGEEVMRVPVHDPEKFDRILTEFINFKSDIIYKFEDALEKFKEDIPAILDYLRKKIDEASIKNKNYIAVSDSFLELCQAEINPDITAADVREMMIQHILTSDIFNKIFDDVEFHRHNNIANELEKLIAVLFNHSERKNLLGSIEHFYDAINTAAASVTDHHEKQKFLKVLYENFYKVYNPKAADRLGVVYTPNEIVKFMIDSTNHLLEKHFDKNLADKNVEILDPATGTGTFVTSIIDSIPKKDLVYKYLNEIHANEVAILPYYVANLNVEFTFKQRMGYYEEYKNLCFVDTLDNTSAMPYGRQSTMFGLSNENSERIRRQNTKRISVIIGNPPYNANQQNENENNKNREYPLIDKRIKDTYIEYSTAQKTKVYDMYARFYRWSMDRIDKNGIIAFITNRSFIDSRTFDGFRQCIQEDFTNCYIVDTKSDVRANPKIAGTTHNVFGIQTGVAIMFLVKKEKELVKGRKVGDCKIEYISIPDEWRKEVKWEWFRTSKIQELEFDRIRPDKNNNWINIADTDFESLVPILGEKRCLFDFSSLGVSTNRDEWVFDLNNKTLIDKMDYFIDKYAKQLKTKKSGNNDLDYSIKWSDALKSHLKKNEKIRFDRNCIVDYFYRPFFQVKYYSDKQLSDRLTANHFNIFGESLQDKNNVITFSGKGSSKQFSLLAVNELFSLDFLEKTQCLPLYRYDESGNRLDNITDWGLEQFCKHYKLKPVKDEKIEAIEQNTSESRRSNIGPDDTYEEFNQPHLKSNKKNELHEPKVKYGEKEISKEDIFHYVYAVLHNPSYRKKYELNLKREFPRIPFYEDFHKWAAWGKSLMALHINYETIKPYSLKVSTIKDIDKPKCKLKADKESGTIEIDEASSLTGIPKEAWNYKLGNRSALEWVLDQYKEKKPSDPTIAEKFNTYRFADYKDKVIDLLKRVCTVSVETMEIIAEMEKEGGN